jgi:catechol 2,3-dioxygenase-like lactoylglutathione lyase family enzyme
MKPRLTHVDSIYLAVKDLEKSTEWFKKHFGLLQDDVNRLKIGNIEVFFLETLDGSSTNFTTKDWVEGHSHFLMPAFCLRAEDIRSLYNDLKSEGVQTEELQDHGWFLEFDFYDIDSNKIKVWEPINKIV